MTSTTKEQITLSSLEEIKHYFKTNTRPYYFISASHFNLMHIDDWVNNLKFINYIDCYDGKHPNVVVPPYLPHTLPSCIEDINAYLLGHKSVVDLIESEQNDKSENAPHSQAVFLFFDNELEEMCKRLKIDICLPSNELVQKIDSKIETTRLGNSAGVSSVPNALEHIDSYETLLTVAKKNNLGSKLVVQNPYGDSGKTTFFISNEEEYNKVSEQIEKENIVKIMKQIRCAGTAIEGCATNAGTFVGPLLTELIGYPELTPYKGGWCGNELFPEAFSDDVKKQAAEMTERLGDALYKANYRGYFEVDYLIDLDTNDVYLGELNARITGISAMTNMSNFCNDTIPLFLFHLLEYSDVKLTLSPKDYNLKSITDGATGSASQIIYKTTKAEPKIIETAPVSGIYTLKDGQLNLVKESYKRRDALKPNEIFIKRIMGVGEYTYKGADLAILFLNKPLKESETKLNSFANEWIRAISNAYKLRDLTDEEKQLMDRYKNSTGFLKGFNKDKEETS
ncbi:biotin carboxylase [bacterium]|jgi:hypothetical protein|nr:biotin carboxylase [bacterium]